MADANEEIVLGDTLAADEAGHDVGLTLAVKQDGYPFLQSQTVYSHCNDATVAYITGNVIGIAGPLGKGGKRGKGGEFQVDIALTVDGTNKASNSWDGLTREGALAFERNLLETWLKMNHDATVAAKATGKI